MTKRRTSGSATMPDALSRLTQNARVEREARLRWVPIKKMRRPPLGQRDLNRARVDRIAADLDIEQLGNPTVNERDGWFWILDGGHRIEALKQSGWGDQQIQCWTYIGLTEAEEAETFLKLNDVLTVTAYDKYTKGVNAGRPVECDIERTIRANGCVISKEDVPGAIRAVGTIRRVYNRSSDQVLGRTLRILTNAYGDAGLESPLIDGIGYLCQRYNGELSDKDAVERLGNMKGGANGLLQKAEQIRRSTGNVKGLCVAAAAVEVINRGRGGPKLTSWWKTDS